MSAGANDERQKNDGDEYLSHISISLKAFRELTENIVIFFTFHVKQSIFVTLLSTVIYEKNIIISSFPDLGDFRADRYSRGLAGGKS